MMEIMMNEYAEEFSLPVFRQGVAAGFPSPADDWLEEEIDLNRYLGFGKASTFLVKVEGSSLERMGIKDGSTLIVDRALKARSGSLIVGIYHGEFLIRILKREKDKWKLEAAHEEFPPIIISDAQEFEVWGVVTHSICNYLKQ